MPSFLHKAYIATLICCLLFLAFIYGIVSAIFHLAPAPDIRIHAVNAYGHLAYLYESLTDTKTNSPAPCGLKTPARHPEP